MVTKLVYLMTCNTGLPEEALAEGIRINEVLFNPKQQAYDNVELMNTSNKIGDASRLFIANGNAIELFI